MNRIRRLSMEIMDQHKSDFGIDFSDNKKALDDISIIRSKGLKNEIAGFITKFIKHEIREQKEKEEREKQFNQQISESQTQEVTKTTDAPDEPAADATTTTDAPGEPAADATKTTDAPEAPAADTAKPTDAPEAPATDATPAEEVVTQTPETVNENPTESTSQS